jgi:ABC-2 type transport system ATP-binding protein
LHNPAVVYLDEPTIGLDVAVKRKIRDFIKEINRRNQTTVILTTHDMGDIEELCKRIIIIDEGRVLYDGELKSIQERFGNKRAVHFELDLLEKFELPDELSTCVEAVAQGEGEDINKVTLTFSNQVISAADVISCMMQNFTVRDLTISDTKIETIVQEIYERGV